MRNKPNGVDLFFFEGQTFSLSGVDNDCFDKALAKDAPFEYENAQKFVFVLDNIAYCAIEDESDGYRSSLDRILIVDERTVKNRFPPVQVKAELQDDTDGGVMDFVDCETGEVVISVGTDHSDDYYPSFVASFNPQNMVTNADPRVVETRKAWGSW